MNKVFLFILLFGLCSCASVNESSDVVVPVADPMTSLQNRLVPSGSEAVCSVCARKFDKAVAACPYDGAKLNPPCKQ